MRGRKRTNGKKITLRIWMVKCDSRPCFSVKNDIWTREWIIKEAERHENVVVFPENGRARVILSARETHTRFPRLKMVKLRLETIPNLIFFITSANGRSLGKLPPISNEPYQGPYTDRWDFPRFPYYYLHFDSRSKHWFKSVTLKMTRLKKINGQTQPSMYIWTYLFIIHT